MLKAIPGPSSQGNNEGQNMPVKHENLAARFPSSLLSAPGTTKCPGGWNIPTEQ